MLACRILCFERSYLVIANAGMSWRDWGNCDRLQWTVANIWWLEEGILQRYYSLITTLPWRVCVNLTALKFWAIPTIENITFQDFLRNVCRGDIFAGSENLTVTRKCRWSLWVFIRYLFFPTRMGKDMLRRQNTVTTSFAHQLDQRRQSHVCFRMTLANNIKLEVLSLMLFGWIW